VGVFVNVYLCMYMSVLCVTVLLCCVCTLVCMSVSAVQMCIVSACMCMCLCECEHTLCVLYVCIIFVCMSYVLCVNVLVCVPVCACESALACVCESIFTCVCVCVCAHGRLVRGVRAGVRCRARLPLRVICPHPGGAGAEAAAPPGWRGEGGTRAGVSGLRRRRADFAL
jgi:hypothetical protein